MTSQKLAALFDADWDWEMQDNPEFASQTGQYDVIHKGGSELQSITSAAYLRRSEHSKEMISAVESILREQEGLGADELVYAKLFLNMHKELSESIDECPLYLIPLNSTGVGCITFAFLESIEWLRFETLGDFDLYKRKLLAFDRLVDENIACLREGIAKGFVANKAVVRDVEKHLNENITGDLSMVLAPLQSDSAATILSASSLLDELKQAALNVRKGFEKFLHFFREEYSKALRESPSCSDLPNGARIYRQCLKFHTTTNMSADEIHKIGLAEVEKIEARYKQEVLIPLGFAPDNFSAFVEHVRSDPKFYVQTSDALLDLYRAVCKDIQTILPNYFNEFPKSPLEITTRNAGPSAFYLAGTPDGRRPGRFYVNISHLEKRPTYEIVCLALHEAIPGHHHQVSLASENSNIPKFQRFVEDRRYEACPCRRNMYSSYVEGWALYCERLGEEMGMYRTPYDLFGRLSMDMMRAVRLVVDTGLHSQGWSIERCIDYMMQKTGRHLHEVEGEVLRYAAWPGQAVAYKVGQLEMLRLRALAEEKLGDRFRLRDFHSVVLNSGPVPLSMLADIVQDYIEKNR